MENENPTLKRKIEEDDKPDVVIKKLKTIEKPIIDINLPNGLIYLDNFISEEEEIDLLKHIDNGKWLNDLSLGSNCVMDFKNIVTKETKAILLKKRALLVMKGQSRYKWMHSISPKKLDEYKCDTFVRGRRVSLTFRNNLMIVSLLLKQFTIHWVFLLFDFFSKMEKDEIIKLNVGGKEIIMLLSTILKFPSLPLGLMFSEEYKRPLKLENGSYFLDRDYKSFEYIVTFYRTNMIPYSILNTNELVFSEFKYWGIHTNSIDLCKPFLSEKMGNLPAIYNSKYYVHILYALENDTDESIFQLPRTYDCLVEILDIPQLIYFESMGPVTRNKIQLQQPLDKIRLYLTREAYLRTEKNIDQLCCIFSRKNAKQMNATMDVLNKNNSFIDKKYGLVYYKDGLVTKMYHY